MKEIKQGDTIMVPFQVLEVREKKEYPYYLGYDTSRIYASTEMLERFQQATGREDSDKTYEDGLREAWEMARKIICNTNHGGFRVSELNEIFGSTEFDDVMGNYTPQEAAAKIAEWEDMKEICVGDVLRDRDTGKEVVVSCTKLRNKKNIFVIYQDGSCGEDEKSDFVKTGRTIDIAGLLAQIGGTDDRCDK